MPQTDLILGWASDWADEFDQDWDEEGLQEFVGKRVKGERRREGEDPKGFEKIIVGYSKMVLVVNDDERVYRWGFICDDGAMVSILSEMSLRVIEDEE